MIRFLQLGNWLADQVVVNWTASSRLVVPKVDELIEREWQAGQRPGVNFFDGPMCRLEKFETSGDSLHLLLSRTSYKPFWGTNLRNPQLADQYGREILANPIGASAILLSRDDLLLMGRRNERVAYYPNHVHPFAGCPEPSERLDVFNEIQRELREELSLQPNDLSDITLAGLVENVPIHQPELMFLVRSKLTKDEIQSRLDLSEHKEMWTLPTQREAIEAALHGNEKFTPIGLAAILLLGRRKFGEKWFAEMCR